MAEKYRLKEPEYPIDLARSAFWKMQPRDADGRWSPTGWLHHTEEQVAAEKTSVELKREEFHATAKTWVGTFSSRGEAITEAQKLETVDFNSLVRAAVDDKGNVKDKQALAVLERHVEDVAKISATLHEPKGEKGKVVEKVEEIANETGHNIGIGSLVGHVASLAAKVAGGSALLIGAERAEAFSEYFHGMLETLPAESLIHASLAVAVAGLVALIRNRLRALKDRRIEKARLAVKAEKKAPINFGPEPKAAT